MSEFPPSAAPTHERWLVRVLAIAAVAFYMGTAHWTRGHEADFGKQWLAARLVATGQGAELYDPVTQRRELESHFSPAVIDHGIWREGIGGPTYPPTLAVVFTPLGWLAPQSAQWVVVQFSVLLVIAAAVQIGRVAGGRISAAAATVAVLGFPGFLLAIGLGQNTALSLFLMVTGWRLLSAGRDVSAGMVWGLFAIKPTWGIALAWVPLAMGRPRVYLGMAAAGAGLFLLTLPWCGFQCWLDWLAVARQTEAYYQELPRWTALSRDLPGVIRRVYPKDAGSLAAWVMLASVAALTSFTWRRNRRAAGAPECVTLLSGIVLTCPRFMFYDMTLAVLPFLLAFSDWHQLSYWSRRCLVALAVVMWAGTAYSYVSWSMLGPPIETVTLVALWSWSIGEANKRSRECDAGASAGSWGRSVWPFQRLARLLGD